MNKIELSGRLTSDIQLRYLSNGTPLLSGCIAVWRGSKVPEGKQDTDFINFRSFSKNVEELSSQLNKGVQIEIKGVLRADQYEKDGQKKTANYVLAFEINLKDAKPKVETKPDEDIDLDSLPF
jgi:single-strand DNA-binding protein